MRSLKAISFFQKALTLFFYENSKNEKAISGALQKAGAIAKFDGPGVFCFSHFRLLSHLLQLQGISIFTFKRSSEYTQGSLWDIFICPVP